MGHLEAEEYLALDPLFPQQRTSRVIRPGPPWSKIFRSGVLLRGQTL